MSSIVEMVAAAEEKAENIKNDATLKAKEIIAEAQEKAKQMIVDARGAASATLTSKKDAAQRASMRLSGEITALRSKDTVKICTAAKQNVRKASDYILERAVTA